MPEYAEQEILPPSLTRNQPTYNQNRYLTHMSLLQPRPSLPRQPSLPAIRTSVPLPPPSRHTLDSGILPRVRSQSIVSPIRPTFAFTSQPAVKSPLSSTSEQHTSVPPTPVAAGNANSDLEREKLNALVIASGLADENEMRVTEPASDSSPSRLCPEEPDRGVPVEVESRRDEDTENYTSSIAPQAQVTTDPYFSRASTSRDIDEFDEDASYYGKEIDPLFSPYSYPPSASKDVSPASKWSLSSSVEMDLGNKRSRSSKALKSKGEKLKSLLSRFSSNSQSSGSDKHVLSFAVDEQEKSIGRQRSHSDLLESVAGRSSESSQAPAIACGSWESVPPTPSALSTTSISISTSYSLATPSDNEDDSNDHGIPTRRYSDEKLPAGKYVSPSESPVSLTRDTSSSSLTCPGTSTSIANSVFDTAGRSLKHSISTASLKTHGLKGLVSKIGLSPAEGSHEESSGGGKGAPKEADKRPTSVPRTFRERMMLRNNGSALSLILGKGGNKTAKAAKPKRKLLISGVERGNYRKYEAISSWCEVSSCCLWYIFPNISPQGFGEVTVNRESNGIIVADFKDVNVANTVSDIA